MAFRSTIWKKHAPHLIVLRIYQMMCENTLPNKIDLPIKIQAHAKRAILFKLLKNMKEKKSVFQFNKAKKKYILMIGENQRHIDEPILHSVQ